MRESSEWRKKHKAASAFLVCCIIMLSVFLCYNSLDNAKAMGDHTQTDKSSGAEAKVAEATVREGSRGETVKTLQRELHQLGYYGGQIDGIYGKITADAVRAFQRDNGLAVDGITGPATWAALNAKAAGNNNSGAGNYNLGDSDTMLLARIIQAEAEGEPYVGKVAVGAVILNRLKSPDFPNTLAGIIYQSGAFAPVSNGRLNSITGSEESIRAAKEALAGSDPTYGCLYFWNPAKATSVWIWSRQIVVRYGNHVFGI